MDREHDRGAQGPLYTSAQRRYLAAARHAELSMKKVPHLIFTLPRC